MQENIEDFKNIFESLQNKRGWNFFQPPGGSETAAHTIAGANRCQVC
jgi:hypothetical protein